LDILSPVLIYKKIDDCPAFFHELCEKDVFLNIVGSMVRFSFGFK